MENKRKLIHIGMMSFALLLRWLNWWQAGICAIVAVLANVFIMPRVGKATFREVDLERGYARGMIFYAVAVLILVLSTPLPVAAAAWGILALGDGSASIVGMRWGSRKWPWSDDKSIAGTIAFCVAGTIAATFLFAFTQTNAAASVPIYDSAEVLIAGIKFASITSIAMICFWTAAILAFVESLPLPLDDNITVPLGSGVALLGLSYVVL